MIFFLSGKVLFPHQLSPQFLKIMRLTAILLTVAFLQVQAKSYPQITLSLKNVSVEKVFYEIERQAGYGFLYTKAMLAGLPAVTIKVKNASINEVLNECFKGQPMTYTIEDKMIVVTKRGFANPERTPNPEPAPPAEIRGRVVSSTGEPLSNVSVIVAGTSVGTTTGIDGRFVLTAPDNKDIVLEFSSVGYQSQRVSVGNRTEVNVTLELDIAGLSDVVVTALGIKRERRTLSYSAQTVSTNDLNEAKEPNVVNSLQGRVAGVTITKTATGPSSSAKVILRGNRSITGNNQPLYVIDGVPMSNSHSGSSASTGGRDLGDGIGMLNSDNIESMTVLKGAAAAALYGSAGQNGAIIITTKSAKAGKISVDYVGNFSIDQPSLLPEIQTEYGQGAGGVYDPHSEQSWGPKIEGQEVTLWNGHTIKMKAEPNRLKDFYRTAKTISNTVSVSGGSEKMQTYFSYGNLYAEGILSNNGVKRNNLDLKITNDITPKLSFLTRISLIDEKIDNTPYRAERIDVVSRINQAPISIPLSEMQQYEYFDDLGSRKQSYWRAGSVFLSNPYWALNYHQFYQRKDRLIGLFQAQYKFTDWLDFQVRGSMDAMTQSSDERQYRDSYNSQGLGEVYNLGNSSERATNVDALLSFNRDLTEKLNLGVRLGGSIQDGWGSGENFTAGGLYREDDFKAVNARNPLLTNSHSRAAEVQSLYAMGTLSFKNYLYLDMTARNDWSSALPKESWSYFYPSAGLIAIVSDMVSLPSWVTFGKARLSIAGSGSGGGPYQTFNYFSLGQRGAITPSTTRAAGDSYKPELTSTFEAGLDWRFLNNRVGFDVTYYNTNTKNQQITIATPMASLFSAQRINAGLVRNRGVEVTLDGRPLLTNSFSWDISVNFAKNDNLIVRLTDELKDVTIINDRQVVIKAEEGMPFGTMYMLNWRKDDQGRHLVGGNGLPLLTGGKDSYVGNYNPNYMMGISNRFTFKNISLGILLDYRNGGIVVAGTQGIMDVYGTSARSAENRETGMIVDGYTEDGQKNATSISPEIFWNYVGNWTPVGDIYAYSGTNLRLREVALGYILPSAWLNKTRLIKSAKLSLVGRNLFFIKRIAPFDPELVMGTDNAGGQEFNSLPGTRNIGLNLKLSF